MSSLNSISLGSKTGLKNLSSSGRGLNCSSVCISASIRIGLGGKGGAPTGERAEMDDETPG